MKRINIENFQNSSIQIVTKVEQKQIKGGAVNYDVDCDSTCGQESSLV